MKIIAIAAQKGGVGKTTITRVLSVEASKTKRVAVIDTDPQGSFSRWFNARKAETPHFLSCDIAHLRKQLNAVSHGLDYIFIDTPPTHCEIVAAAIQHADLVIVPTLPTQDDLDSIAPTLAMIRQDQKHLIVLNRCDMRNVLAKQARSALAEVSTAAKPYLSMAEAHPQSLSDGRAAQELNQNGKAACEIAALWKCVLAEIAR